MLAPQEVSVKIVLIRHAAAVPRGTPGVLDTERPLTSSGRVKFRSAARGLARIMPRPTALLTSPLPRAQETAEIAAQAFANIEPVIERALGDESVDDILTALKAHSLDSTVALVGHEPVLGALLARTLGAGKAEGLAFRKGGVALVDLPEGPTMPGRLIWFLEPRVLRALANRRGVASKTRKAP